VQQVTVRAVDFKEVETGFDRVQGGEAPLLAQGGKLGDLERMRRQPALIHRDRARRHDPPWQIAARAVGRIEHDVAEPRPLDLRDQLGNGRVQCREREELPVA
jgi:hypothetical protein